MALPCQTSPAMPMPAALPACETDPDSHLLMSGWTLTPHGMSQAMDFFTSLKTKVQVQTTAWSSAVQASLTNPQLGANPCLGGDQQTEQPRFDGFARQPAKAKKAHADDVLLESVCGETVVQHAAAQEEQHTSQRCAQALDIRSSINCRDDSAFNNSRASKDCPDVVLARDQIILDYLSDASSALATKPAVQQFHNSAACSITSMQSAQSGSASLSVSKPGSDQSSQAPSSVFRDIQTSQHPVATSSWDTGQQVNLPAPPTCQQSVGQLLGSESILLAQLDIKRGNGSATLPSQQNARFWHHEEAHQGAGWATLAGWVSSAARNIGRASVDVPTWLSECIAAYKEDSGGDSGGSADMDSKPALEDSSSDGWQSLHEEDAFPDSGNSDSEWESVAELLEDAVSDSDDSEADKTIEAAELEQRREPDIWWAHTLRRGAAAAAPAPAFLGRAHSAHAPWHQLPGKTAAEPWAGLRTGCEGGQGDPHGMLASCHLAPWVEEEAVVQCVEGWQGPAQVGWLPAAGRGNFGGAGGGAGADPGWVVL